MAESVAGEAINFIGSTGVLQVLIKFILGFAIPYGILEKTHVFGKGQQRLHALISLAFGLIAVLSF